MGNQSFIVIIYTLLFMGKILGSASIDKSFRMYIPEQVQKALELTPNDELAFELENEKVIIWRNIVTKSIVRKISKIK